MPNTQPEKELKVLFIAEKWCAGIYERGIAEWERNLVLSFEAVIPSIVETFSFDEYYRVNKKPGDEALLQKLGEWKPDMIVLVTNLMPGTSPHVLTFPTLKTIKDELKIPIMALFGDPQAFEQEKISRAVLPYVNFIFATASEAVVRRIKASMSEADKKRYIYTWVPKNPKIWNDPGKTRDIGVSYYGSWKENRPATVQFLKDSGIPVVHGGGEAGEHLTTEEFADRFKRSKISLSFARSCYQHMVDARTYEAPICGSMLLEEESSQTPKLLVPFEDYVPYWDNKDLLRKAKYYLEHDEERERIAKNGREKVNALFSAKRHWELAVDMAFGSPKKIKAPEFVLTWSDLRHMPKWRAVKLKFIDALIRTRPGFALYYGIMSRANKVWLYRQIEKVKILSLYRKLKNTK